MFLLYETDVNQDALIYYEPHLQVHRKCNFYEKLIFDVKYCYQLIIGVSLDEKK